MLVFFNFIMYSKVNFFGSTMKKLLLYTLIFSGYTYAAVCSLTQGDSFLCVLKKKLLHVLYDNKTQSSPTFNTIIMPHENHMFGNFVYLANVILMHAVTLYASTNYFDLKGKRRFSLMVPYNIDLHNWYFFKKEELKEKSMLICHPLWLYLAHYELAYKDCYLLSDYFNDDMLALFIIIHAFNIFESIPGYKEYMHNVSDAYDEVSWGPKYIGDWYRILHFYKNNFLDIPLSMPDEILYPNFMKIDSPYGISFLKKYKQYYRVYNSF